MENWKDKYRAKTIEVEEKKEFRSDYDHYESLYKFTKPRSPRAIEIIRDPAEEDWFYYVISYQKKSGEIKRTEMITRRDIETWVDRIQRLKGFEKIEPVEEMKKD